METTNIYSSNSAQVEPQTIVAKQRGNGIGIAGFIMAVLGLFFCWAPFLKWILIIPAILLSFIGSFRQPRLFALIGLGISVVTTILIVSWKISMINSLFSLAL